MDYVKFFAECKDCLKEQKVLDTFPLLLWENALNRTSYYKIEDNTS